MEKSLIGYLCSINLLLASQKFRGDVVMASVDLENRRKINLIVREEVKYYFADFVHKTASKKMS